MNKIKIEVSIAHLHSLNDALSIIPNINVIARTDKVSKSVLVNLSKKLLRKAITKLESKSKFKIAFEYYEAHFLEQFLLRYNSLKDDRLLQNIIDALNQKLG